MVQSTHMLVAVIDDEAIVGLSNLALQPSDGLVPGEVDQFKVDLGHGGSGSASSPLQTFHAVAPASLLSDLVPHASLRAAPVFEAAAFQHGGRMCR